MKTIGYSRQSINDSDIAAMTEVLRGDWLTQGPAVTAFENVVAAYCGAKHAVAACNGTATLHLAMLALKIGPGNLVWTSPNSFVASANCARYCGADVDFVDIDPVDGNMSMTALAEKLAAAKRSNRLPDVIIPVHFAGEPIDLEALAVLKHEYGFKVVEDAAHALGASYKGKPIGDCRFSEAASFSFHPVKSITSGEGGMVVTNDDEIARRLRLMVSHGLERDPARMNEPSHGAWFHQVFEIGMNYRLTDIQAALGWNQMQRLDSFIDKRQALAARYDERLAGLPIQPLRHNAPGRRSALHLYVIRIAQNGDPERRRKVYDTLRAAGINTQVHYIPIHTQPAYRALGFKHGDFPQAEAYYRDVLSLPLYPDLTTADQDRVLTSLRAALG